MNGNRLTYLVLALDDIQLLDGLVPGGAQAEELAIVVAALFLAGLQLSVQVVHLSLPFANDLR